MIILNAIMEFIKQNLSYIYKIIQPKNLTNSKSFRKPDAYKNINSNRMLIVKQN